MGPLMVVAPTDDRQQSTSMHTRRTLCRWECTRQACCIVSKVDPFAYLDFGRVKQACLTHDDTALDKNDSLEQRAPPPHGRWVRGKTLRP